MISFRCDDLSVTLPRSCDRMHGKPLLTSHRATHECQQHQDHGDEGSSKDPACQEHGMGGGNTLSKYIGT